MTRATMILATATLALACRGDAPEPSRASPTEAAPTEPAPEPEDHLIRFACRGFDAAVTEGAPNQRLLATAATRAVELGGPRVEVATRRWALMPPQDLLAIIERYETETGVAASECAGLRRHLERMSLRSSAH